MPSIRSLLLTLAMAGCATPGPRDLPVARLGYNEVIARSSNEQLLLNLVRLRYSHAPQFFEVTQVTTQSAVVRSGTLALDLALGNNLVDSSIFTPFVSPGLRGSLQLEERPTVSYQPLQGQAFAERLVRPIDPGTLLMLADVGWRIDRLLECCVQRINGISAPIIASRDPRFGGVVFHRVGELLYQLQLAGALEMALVRFTPDGAPELRMSFVPTSESARFTEQLGEVQRLLDLDPTVRSYTVSAAHDEVAATTSSRRIVMRERSLLGAMVYLSQGVAVPPSDRAARSLDYVNGRGEPIAVGSQVPGALLTVEQLDAPPPQALASARFQGRWFAVRDDDQESKQVLMLLQVLYSAVSATQGAGPVLTIPVGQ